MESHKDIRLFNLEISRLGTLADLQAYLQPLTLSTPHFQTLLTRTLRPFSKSPQFPALLIQLAEKFPQSPESLLFLKTIMSEKLHQDVAILKDFIISLLIKGLSENWATELLLSDLLAKEDLVQGVFGLQSIALNYIEGCPRELIREVFYGRVISSLVGSYGELKSQSFIPLIISKIALNNLTDILMSQTLPQPLIDDLFSSLYRETFLLYALKHSLPYQVTLTHSDLLAIERTLINTKHPTKQLADTLLSLKDAQMLLSPVLRLWKQPQLVNIGSLKQQAFVTYLAYHLINRNQHVQGKSEESSESVLDEDDELGAWVREGIEVRIGKVQSEKVVYDMGLVVWKAYMIAQGIEDQEVLQLQRQLFEIMQILNRQLYYIPDCISNQHFFKRC